MSTPRGSTRTPRRPSTSASAERSEDGELIVSRGLQELLEKERNKNKPETSSGLTPRGPQKKKKGAARPQGAAPNFVICYLCGRQFGSASIGIHRPQCYLKKMIEWERADPATRGAQPVDPETHEKKMKDIMKESERGATAGAGGPKMSRAAAEAAATERRNNAEYEAFTQQLAPCPNCGRTFLPDRLVVHLRSCKPGAAAAKPLARRNPSTTAAAAGTASPSATPTKNTNSSPAARPAPRASPNAAAGAGSMEDQPVKASGAYTLPPGVTEDSAPPGASEGTSARKRRVSFKDESGTAEAEAEAAEGALNRSEGRLSTHALEDAGMEEVSAPDRPPSMGDAADSEDAVPPPLPPPARSHSHSQQQQRHADPAAEAEGEDEGESGDTPVKKIPLNNVSRFKNVQSRLKMEIQKQKEQQESSLVPCRYCGRTFNPDRVARHEDCCAERGKAPPPASRNKAAGKKAMPKTVKRPATTPSAPASSAAPAPASASAAPAAARASSGPLRRFCTECGADISAGGKFCSSCGAKL